MTETTNDQRDHAGPFGFTRREIAVLAGIIALSVIVIAYDSWQENRHQEAATWVIEDVLVQSSPVASPSDSTDSNQSVASRDRSARQQSDLINVNTGDVRALARLPGIGAELARRMITEREAHGNFVSLTDLQRVNGIGPRKAAMLSGWVTFATPAATMPEVPTVDSMETP